MNGVQTKNLQESEAPSPIPSARNLSEMSSPLALPSLARPLRLVFMGTPDFAVPSLQALLESEDEVVGVVCQPDKPAGRHMDLHAPPVKECARSHAIPIFQPQKIRTPETLAHLQSWQPDLIVVAAYGKILPKSVLDLPPAGCINVHASLLPKYRGAAPIQWAIARGETHSGVTIMQVSEQMDAGHILLQQSVALKPDETGGQPARYPRGARRTGIDGSAHPV